MMLCSFVSPASKRVEPPCYPRGPLSCLPARPCAVVFAVLCVLVSLRVLCSRSCSPLRWLCSALLCSALLCSAVRRALRSPPPRSHSSHSHTHRTAHTRRGGTSDTSTMDDATQTIAQRNDATHDAHSADAAAPAAAPAPAAAAVPAPGVLVQVVALDIAVGGAAAQEAPAHAEEAAAAAHAAPALAALADPPQCKICFESESSDATGPLFRPCRCRGSSLVHSRCLQQWRQQAPDPTRCETCRHIYQTSRRGWHRFLGSNSGVLVCSTAAVAGSILLLHSLLPRRAVHVVAESAQVPPTVDPTARWLPWHVWRDNLFGTPTPIVIVRRPPPALWTAEMGLPPQPHSHVIHKGWHPSPFFDSLSRITAVLSVLCGRRNPYFADGELTRAMLTGTPANEMQRRDVVVECGMTLFTVGATAIILWKKTITRWIAATPAEEVLPYQE